MKKNKIKVIFLIIFTCVVSTLFFAGTNAMYRSINYLKGKGSVAKFDFVITPPVNTNLNIDGKINSSGVNNQTQTSYTFSITNTSDVSINYTIRLEFASNLPAGLSISMGGQTYTGDGTKKAFNFNGGTILISSANQTNSHTFTITANFNNLLNDFNANATVHVDASQYNG